MYILRYISKHDLRLWFYVLFWWIFSLYLGVICVYRRKYRKLKSIPLDVVGYDDDEHEQVYVSNDREHEEARKKKDIMTKNYPTLPDTHARKVIPGEQEMPLTPRRTSFKLVGWEDFLSNLVNNNFFAGYQEGTAEYAQRMIKARAAYDRRMGQENDPGGYR